ncbi:hypothetical protein LOTGIDRAFT_153920 [Lottia gigantea]|uniref:DDE Tnp4 domain-containing protein n=1 Tax=Lottia gigantea TaxID=225164 RepID=V4ADS9_LOTGI|nr:hypothetical protein LOTGIDRAFT_153920 [Lottia gigantea]ESO91476.1 hypothetical protein LOTGIDRAFT_153920 [Lottia gigantea]
MCVSQKHVETFLVYLASGGYYRNVGFSTGVAKTSTLLYVHEVADFFLSIAPRFIKLPRPEEYPNLTTTVRDVDGNNKDIILYIDGVIIRIQRPDHAGDAYYCGRHGKSCDSIDVQYVCDKFGRIRHVISGLPGSTLDKIVAEWSPEFMQYLHTLPNDVVVLGDPSYRNLHPSVMHTFTGANLNQQQMQFNDTCTRQR